MNVLAEKQQSKILKEQTEHVKKTEQFGKVEQLQKSKGENENE